MDFDTAFSQLIGNEGGYQDDPRDRGNWTGGDTGKGLLKGTKFGISARSYPAEDIENLTADRAKEIYLRDYWGPAGCDSVPDCLKFDLFDMAVNSGVKQAIRSLQGAVGETQDGVLGPLTLQAIQSMPPGRLYARFNSARLNFLTGLPDSQWLAYGRGLVNRIANNMMRA